MRDITMNLKINFGKEYKEWVKKYGEEFVIASISNEMQMYTDNISEDVFEGHREVYPELLTTINNRE